MDVTSCIIEKAGEFVGALGQGLKKLAGVVDTTMVVTTGAAATAAQGVRNILDGDEEKKEKLRKTGTVIGIIGAACLVSGVAIAIATKAKKKTLVIEEIEE